MTRGRRALLAVLQRTTTDAVAATCRVARQQVSSWASGLTTPSAAARAALASRYGIPGPAWDDRLPSTKR